jgi:hypothetical protein
VLVYRAPILSPAVAAPGPPRPAPPCDPSLPCCLSYCRPVISRSLQAIQKLLEDRGIPYEFEQEEKTPGVPIATHLIKCVCS